MPQQRNNRNGQVCSRHRCVPAIGDEYCGLHVQTTYRPETTTLLIYGATGYIGRISAERAKALG